MFAHSLWNISARVASDLPRTTNGVEGWHSALGRSIRIDHPNVWMLIKQLKQETVTTLTALANSQASLSTQLSSSNHNNKYAKINKYIQKVLEELNNGELAVMSFLRNVAQRIELSV